MVTKNEVIKDINIKPKRVVYFDILNIMAILAVIALHCNGIVHIYSQARAWYTSLIIECVCYWGVPVFIMLTGATLTNYREKYDTKTFFRKRFIKVCIPFMFWTVFMFVWTFGKNIFSEFSNFKELLNAFFESKEQGEYYFLFEILGIYLTIPLLSLLTKVEYRKTLWFTVCLYFIFNATLPNVLKIFGIYYNESFSIKFSGFFIFAILGYLASTQNFSKIQKRGIYIGAIIGVIFRYIVTVVYSQKLGRLYNDFWSYNTWYAMLQGLAIFIFVKDIGFLNKINNMPKTQELLGKIASCSFGIYLIHVIIMNGIVKLFKINVYSIIYRILGIIFVYCITLIIIMILKKIPFLRKIVP